MEPTSGGWRRRRFHRQRVAYTFTGLVNGYPGTGGTAALT